MKEEVRQPLYLTDRDGISLFRALLEYDKILRLSMIKDSVLVNAELLRVRDLQERISLISFYPDEAAE